MASAIWGPRSQPTSPQKQCHSPLLAGQEPAPEPRPLSPDATPPSPLPTVPTTPHHTSSFATRTSPQGVFGCREPQLIARRAPNLPALTRPEEPAHVGPSSRHPTPENGPCNPMPGCTPDTAAMEKRGQSAWTTYSVESCGPKGTFQLPMQGREVGRQPWGCPRGCEHPSSCPVGSGTGHLATGHRR